MCETYEKTKMLEYLTLLIDMDEILVHYTKGV
uniref:Uncharacterized protein n=1 Tax=Arundo donax TaxID=35708 RepID=A0A0A8YIQ8_ARUDO